jgi:hypothetical protein
LSFFTAAAIANAEANPVVLGSTSNSSFTTMEPHCYFLDESKLVASTTHSHMLVMLECLLAKQNMTIGSTEWQDTDG